MRPAITIKAKCPDGIAERLFSDDKLVVFTATERMTPEAIAALALGDCWRWAVARIIAQTSVSSRYQKFGSYKFEIFGPGAWRFFVCKELQGVVKLKLKA